MTDAATISISILAILISFVTYRILKSHRPQPTSNDACGDNLTAVDFKSRFHNWGDKL
jgi:hypothetical protein